MFFQAKLETKALKAKRPGFTDDRYSETSYYVEAGKQQQQPEEEPILSVNPEMRIRFLKNWDLDPVFPEFKIPQKGSNFFFSVPGLKEQ